MNSAHNLVQIFLAAAILVLFVAAAFPPQEKTGSAGNPVVVIETSAGTITAELYPDKAPKTVANFLGYVKTEYYSGTIFHRVIKGFMVQGGGLTANLRRKPPTQPMVINEATNGLSNLRGTLAMARTSDIHSATSQFFINTVDNVRLDHRGETGDTYGYCVFGKVIDGMDVVDKIEGTPTNTVDATANVPVQAITIKAIRLKAK
ncbi:MAG: peptidyl-prolyl cis-trans isomerase [Acidobacteria bacterium]|nr:peptidyl-prolyl cis-trans isomerase [Acidobacteriota bacterium]